MAANTGPNIHTTPVQRNRLPRQKQRMAMLANRLPAAAVVQEESKPLSDPAFKFRCK